MTDRTTLQMGLRPIKLVCLLKRGGLLAFVSKREAKPLELITAAGFDLLNTFTRRGYTILLATRR